MNEFFATLKGQSRDEMQPQVQAYLDANPQVRTELQGIKQPAVDFLNRCGGRIYPSGSNPSNYGSDNAVKRRSSNPSIGRRYKPTVTNPDGHGQRMDLTRSR